MNTAFLARLNRMKRILLIVGLITLALTALGAVANKRQFFFSYLFACLFWLGLSLGCFMVTMIHQLTGGRWGYPTRRFLEAGFLALPLMLVLFIPVFLGLHELYPWARPDEVASEPVLLQRHGYQNTWTYIARSILFFAITSGMAWSLR